MNDYGVLTAPDTLRLERLLPGPIERVWQYLTESDKRATWLAAGDVEQRVGGKVEHTFRNSELSPEHDIPPPKYADCAGDVAMLGKVTACGTGVAIGFAVIQALALGFAQADGLAEPESFEGAGAGWGAGGIAHARAHGRESSTEDNRCRCVVGTGLYRAAARRAVAG